MNSTINQTSSNRINSSYIPTEEDRENDRRMELWQEQRREESRKAYLRYQNDHYSKLFSS